MLMVSEPPASSNIRILAPGQALELLDVHEEIGERAWATDAANAIVAAVAGVLGVTVALVDKNEGAWTVLAESGADASPPPIGPAASRIFDRVAAARAVAIDVWTHGTEQWTLVGLTRRSLMPAVLMLHHDWTLSAATLERLGRNLLLAERAHSASSSARVRAATHRLTRALARSSGFERVADIAVRNASRAVRAQIATLAIADANTKTLRIMATHGYPVKLVEHLRIARGDGVIGSVYETGLPLRVTDVMKFHGPRKRRSRYRTNSFAAVPIASADEVLGVLCVTDRADGRPFAQSDLSTLRTLAAPLALALGRERALAQAGSYAEAAVIDPVSGLYNRRYFHTRIQEELQRAQRHALSVGLLMIDADDFKVVNDTFGHLVGDTVIHLIADVLRRSVRVFDICTRFGGEEFAVLMPGSSAEDAVRVAERIRQRAENCTSTEPGLESVKVTVSIGLAVSRPDSSPRDLINRADVALYEAKRGGKNRVRADASGDSGRAAG